MKKSTSDIGSKLAIGVAVANHKAVCDVIVGVVYVFLYQSGIGFTGWGVVFREVRVQKYVVKHDTFAAKGVQDKVLDRPEGLFGESRRAQTILIAHHDHFVVGVLAQKSQAGNSTWYELQFFERVYLLVGRFADDGSVTVNEENLFHAL